jgi:Domain of unknown function (DUF5658)
LASNVTENSSEGGRSRTDRRLSPTSPLDAFRRGGRRVWPRRAEDSRGEFFVDRFDSITLALVLTLLSLTILDGMLTLELLEMHGEEANPIMRLLLTRGPVAFLLGKYILTAVGLPFIVVYKNYPLFGTRFRAGFLVPAFIGMYAVLIFYQWTLLHPGPSRTNPSRSGDVLASDSRPGRAIYTMHDNHQQGSTP